MLPPFTGLHPQERVHAILRRFNRKHQGRMIHLIRTRANREQIDAMLQVLGDYIKLAVDIQRGILAGGGELHPDCEDVLLEDGSSQADIWGADWYSVTQEVGYESLINIRPRQNNRSMEILDSAIRERVAQITHHLLGDR